MNKKYEDGYKDASATMYSIAVSVAADAREDGRREGYTEAFRDVIAIFSDGSYLSNRLIKLAAEHGIKLEGET